MLKEFIDKSISTKAYVFVKQIKFIIKSYSEEVI